MTVIFCRATTITTTMETQDLWLWPWVQRHPYPINNQHSWQPPKPTMLSSSLCCPSSLVSAALQVSYPLPYLWNVSIILWVWLVDDVQLISPLFLWSQQKIPVASPASIIVSYTNQTSTRHWHLVPPGYLQQQQGFGYKCTTLTIISVGIMGQPWSPIKLNITINSPYIYIDDDAEGGQIGTVF